MVIYNNELNNTIFKEFPFDKQNKAQSSYCITA